MKYRPEKAWIPNTDFAQTYRNLRREEEKFTEKIQKKAAPFLKWVYINYLSKAQKSRIYEYYRYNCEYYNFIGNDKETDSTRIINKLINCGIFTEKEAKTIKRKWVVNVLIS